MDTTIASTTRHYPLLLPNNPSSPLNLPAFQSSLSCLGLCHSSLHGIAASCLVFALSAIVIPLLNAAWVSCPPTDEAQRHLFESVVELSESALAAVAFFSLLYMLRVDGLTKVLLLDGIERDSRDIQQAYNRELRNALNLLARVLLPFFFIVELVREILWLRNASVEIPYVRNNLVKKSIVCSAAMVAWLYRTSIFLFTCVLFRLMCSLQILRLEGYYMLLEAAPPVFVILQEHMRLRDQLFCISHRFRIFIVFSLFIITLSQFVSLFELMGSRETISFERTGDLLVCCAVQLIGFVFCLHGAAKITHKAQRIVSIVSQWHAVATCIDDDDDIGSSSEAIQCCIPEDQHFPTLPMMHIDSYGDLEASLHLFYCTKDAIGDSYSYEKRHALVTYLQHCSAGISVYGFVMDRTLLYTIFAFEVSLVLWILGKTVVLIKS